MQHLAADFGTFVEQFGTHAAWWQAGVLTIGFLTAWLVARLIRARLPVDLDPGALKIGTGSVHRLVLPLFALITVWFGSFMLSKWQPVPLLKIAIPLIASFVIIRLAVYLLRHVIPASPLLKASERILAYGVWVIVALYLSGILPEISGALDEIGFTVGQRKITLLLILHAVFWSACTVIVALAVSRIIEKRLIAAETLDMSMRVFSGKIVRALAVVLAILIALTLIGIDITVLSVFGGALGVGLGLGLQKIASNYVSGFVILLDRSIRPGDLVTIGERQGVVADIKARYTVLRGLDGTEAIIPNDTIIGNTVLNHTYSNPKISVKTSITVAYESNVQLAMSLFLAAGKSQDRVLADPEPIVLLTAMGDNGLNLEIVTWIEDADQGQAPLRSAILLEAWRLFREQGIEVPFPRRDVRIVAGDVAAVVQPVPPSA